MLASYAMRAAVDGTPPAPVDGLGRRIARNSPGAADKPSGGQSDAYREPDEIPRVAI